MQKEEPTFARQDEADRGLDLARRDGRLLVLSSLLMLLRTRRTLIVATPDSLVRAPIVRGFEPERDRSRKRRLLSVQMMLHAFIEPNDGSIAVAASRRRYASLRRLICALALVYLLPLPRPLACARAYK